MRKLLLSFFGLLFCVNFAQAQTSEYWSFWWTLYEGKKSTDIFTAADGNSYGILDAENKKVRLCRIADENISATGTTIPTTVTQESDTYTVTELGPGFLGLMATSFTVPKLVVTSIDIPEGIERICTSAFRKQSLLTSVTIPSSVRTLDVECFRECSALNNVSLPEVLETIEHGCFMGCI